ncbi:CbrC family protein [Asanoa sp. NPDC049518]|uniref:CbrC family protein n=1 Tax=unclassified Asanoa TaxID=2685164 RepID=UPI003447EDA2
MFRYHPDPIATGSAERAEFVCHVCGQHREVRYTGPIYGRRAENLCLDCIHSGEASRALGTVAVPLHDGETLEMPAEFSDAVGVPDDVPRDVVTEITQRTPGFVGWQQESWLYHCADGAAYLGPAGHAELQRHPDAYDIIRTDLLERGWPAEEADNFMRRFDRTGEPTAYLFRCLHCTTHLASWDIG